MMARGPCDHADARTGSSLRALQSLTTGASQHRDAANDLALLVEDGQPPLASEA